MARKTEVYTWRVSSAMKADLEDRARAEGRSVARLLDDIVGRHLGEPRRDADAAQRLLHARARRFAGRITGADPRRAERARVLVRARLGSRAHRRGR